MFAEENVSHGTRMILVGSKCDLVEDRQVKEAEIMELCEKNRISYVECSAKKDWNVGELIEELLWDEPAKE